MDFIDKIKLLAVTFGLVALLIGLWLFTGKLGLLIFGH
jgi:hypothetical protein